MSRTRYNILSRTRINIEQDKVQHGAGQGSMLSRTRFNVEQDKVNMEQDKVQH